MISPRNLGDEYNIAVAAPILLPQRITLLTLIFSVKCLTIYTKELKSLNPYTVKINRLNPTECNVLPSGQPISVKIEETNSEPKIHKVGDNGAALHPHAVVSVHVDDHISLSFKR